MKYKWRVENIEWVIEFDFDGSEPFQKKNQKKKNCHIL